MRRHDREVTDIHEIQTWFDDFDVCRLGFVDNKYAYIVPLNFGVSFTPRFELYFHSAKEGKKINLMMQHPYVSFELDGRHRLIKAEQACNVSMSYISVMGQGVLEVIHDLNEKKEALLKIMEHNTHQKDWTFNEHSLERVFVYKLTVDSYSAKQHKEKGS